MMMNVLMAMIAMCSGTMLWLRSRNRSVWSWLASRLMAILLFAYVGLLLIAMMNAPDFTAVHVVPWWTWPGLAVAAARLPFWISPSGVRVHGR